MDITFLEQLKVALTNIGVPIGEVLLHGVPWFFPFAFIGFILASLIIYVLIKKNIMLRKNRVWNVLAKLSYLALLIFLPLSTGAAGAVYQTQSLTHEMLDDELLPAITNRMPAFNGYLTEQAERLDTGKMISVKDLLDPLLLDLYYSPQSDSLLETVKARIINKVIMQTIASAATEGVQTILITQIELLGSALSEKDYKGQPQGELVKLGVGVVTKFTTDIAKELDYTQVNASLPMIIVSAIAGAIDSYFNTIYIMILLSLLLLVGLITAEIYFYRRHLRKIDSINEAVLPATP